MKPWNKVTFTWECYMGLPTGVLMDGRVDLKVINPKIYSSDAHKRVHGIFAMEAVSLPNEGELRRGEMVIAINGCMRSTTAPNKSAVLALLRAEMKRRTTSDVSDSFRYEPQVIAPEGNSWADNKFTIRFTMENGEQFCDYAIVLGEAVFTALGVHDEQGLHLAGFTIVRESFMKLEGAWITFARWLRIKHRLPIFGPEDQEA